MKPTLHASDLFILVIISLPFFYLAYIFNTLPQTVPTHFGISGKPDRFSDKSAMWGIISFTGGISMLLFLLFRFLPNIDPKKTAKYSAPVFNKIAVAVVLLMCAINFIIINSAQTGAFKFSKGMPVVIGLFFSFMGNLMHSIKPNYFAGIRTPWTLENEETWRLTHQLGGKLWFFGGIVIAVASLFIPEKAMPFFMMGCILILAVIPIVYSYTTFKKIEKREKKS
ncbi:MAG TPA: SdpI family protein [Chitinophagaceae bacterium]|nr:SdpI family protein [Chitinophagaceae bacterium]